MHCDRCQYLCCFPLQWYSSRRVNTSLPLTTSFLTVDLLTYIVFLSRWNFPFPTEAERITWLVSSLACVVVVGIYSFASTIPMYVIWFESRKLFPFCTKAFNARKGFWYRVILLVEIFCFAIYVFLRLAIMALAFSSLRALPVGSYTTVEWVMSIPHV